MRGGIYFGDTLYFEERGPEHTLLRIELKNILLQKKSKVQHIAVAESYEYGRILVLDGSLMLTERDEFIYHEMISHVPLLLHPKPKKILIIGGGDGGTVRELLKHNVEQIDLIEIDEDVVQTCREYFPQIASGLDDPRVSLLFEDGNQYVKRTSPATYDVIIIDSSDPVGPAEGLFTAEFYQDCRNALTYDGMIVAQAESPYVYPKVLKQIYQLFRQIFSFVSPYRIAIPTYASGQLCFMFGSKKDLNESIFNDKRIKEFFTAQNRNLNYLNESIMSSVFNNAEDVLRVIGAD